MKRRNYAERAEDEILEHGGPRVTDNTHFTFPINYGSLSKTKNHIRSTRIDL